MSTQLSQIPGYFTLRAGADLASAARGTTVYFDYGDGMLEITDPPQPRVAPPVPVRSSLSAVRTPASRAEVTVGSEGAEYGSVLLNAAAYSALVWGESAVEKFLLPYYASAGGPHAYAVVHAINKAWYDFPVRYPVCALAFAYPPDALQGEWDLWDTVHVLHVQDPLDERAGLDAPYVLGTRPGPQGRLAMTPLLRYLRSFPPLETVIPPPPDAPLPRVRAPEGTEPTPVDSIGAREVAEYVSGLRGYTVRVYATGRAGGLEATLSPRPRSGPPLFEASSPFVRAGRPVVSVSLAAGDGPLHPLDAGSDGPASRPDSVFWSDGSVEMLMAPYYTSVEGKGSPWYLMALLWKWAGIIDPDVTDALPLLADIGQRVQQEIVALETDQPLPPRDTRVFAIIHLPNSDWVDAGDGFTFWLEHRTVLLTADGNRHPLVSHGRRLVLPGR